MREELASKPLPVTPIKAAVVSHSMLDNGVQIVTSDSASPTVGLKFALIGGSSTEKACQKGAAQFLAAAAFSGSAKTSGLRIVRFLESKGARFSASADREKISYDVTVLPEHVDEVVGSILSAIATGPHAPYVFEEARENVALSHGQYASRCGFGLSELLVEAAYGEGSAYGSPLFGNYTKLSVDSIMEYRNAHFTQENLIVVGSGVSQEVLKASVAKHAAAVAKGAAVALPALKYIGGDLKVRADLGGKTQMALGFPVSNGNASKVLVHALDSALKHKKIHAKTCLQTFAQGGLLAIHAHGCATSSLSSLQAAVAELKALSSAEDFYGAAAAVTLDQLAPFEGHATCQLLCAHVSGKAAQADARTVTKKDVQDAAKAVLASKPTFVTYGATAGTPASFTI